MDKKYLESIRGKCVSCIYWSHPKEIQREFYGRCNVLGKQTHSRGSCEAWSASERYEKALRLFAD